MFCKICGSELEDESFFCPACGAHIKSRQDDTFEISKMKQAVKREESQPPMSSSPSRPFSMFSYRHSHASQSTSYFPLVFGLMILTIAITMMFPAEAEYILPSGFMAIGLAILFSHYHRSPNGYENRLAYFAIACIVLTFGFAIMFSSGADYIIPAGFMLAALLLTGHFARRSRYQSSRHNPVLYGIIVVVILTLGSAMMFPSVVDYIFPTGGIVMALIIIAWALRRSSPRQLSDDPHSFQP